MTTPMSIIRQDGEGQQLWFAGGGLFTMKATFEETNKPFALFEDQEVGGKATPLHRHPNNDEVLYVLEGEIVAYIAGAERRVGKGGIFVALRGEPHAFMVTSEAARLLAMTVPGTGWAEVSYRELCDPAEPGAVLGSHPTDFVRLGEVAAAHSDSIEILGPPPFGSTQPVTPA